MRKMCTCGYVCGWGCLCIDENILACAREKNDDKIIFSARYLYIYIDE